MVGRLAVLECVLRNGRALGNGEGLRVVDEIEVAGWVAEWGKRRAVEHGGGGREKGLEMIGVFSRQSAKKKGGTKDSPLSEEISGRERM